MPWTDPPDFPTGTTVTSATLNTYLRDNFESLRDQNDMNVALVKTANQNLGNASFNALSFEVAKRNLGSLWASASNTKILLPAVARWRAWGAVTFSSNSTVGSRQVVYRLNGATLNYELEMTPADIGGGASAVGNDLITLNFAVDLYTSTTNQFLQYWVFQDSGTTASVLGTATAATLWHTMAGLRMVGEWVSAT